jgi:hypothetical protein
MGKKLNQVITIIKQERKIKLNVNLWCVPKVWAENGTYGGASCLWEDKFDKY